MKSFSHHVFASLARIARNTNKYAALTLLIILLTSACARRARLDVKDARVGWRQEGIASWYGHPYHGRAAASGEIYDMHRLTAAHQRLPFDTVVRVEHRATKQSVDVRINDRGPFVKGRILDVSREAAGRIGLLTPGTGRVKLRVIEKPPTGERHAVQAGVFSTLNRAEALRDRLERRFPGARIYAGPNGYRVVLGEGSRAEAERARAQAVAEGLPDATVFRRSR
jgi:rare lipoprotein A